MSRFDHHISRSSHGPDRSTVAWAVIGAVVFLSLAGWITIAEPLWSTSHAASGQPAMSSAERPAIAGPFSHTSPSHDPRLAQPDGVGDRFFATTASIPAKLLRGRRVELSGAIQTDLPAGSMAGLWLRAHDATGRTTLFDNMAARPVTGRSGWTRHAIDLALPGGTEYVYFGVLVAGDGLARFDDLRLSVDGQAIDVSAYVDLDFESPTLRGFALPQRSRFDARLTTDAGSPSATCLSVRSGTAVASGASGDPVPTRSPAR